MTPKLQGLFVCQHTTEIDVSFRYVDLDLVNLVYLMEDIYLKIKFLCA